MNKQHLDILIEGTVNVGSDQLTQQQIDFVNAIARGMNNRSKWITYKWSVVDGKVNVFGDITLNGQVNNNIKNLTHLPVQFNTVSGIVFITDTKLVDLTGLPNKVFSDFYCRDNELTSLRGCPTIIQGDFNCAGNKLANLLHFPKVKGNCVINENSFQLNDQLFEDIKAIGGKKKIINFRILLEELKKQIPIQFGVDKPRIINQIWKSYTNILEAK